MHALELGSRHTWICIIYFLISWVIMKNQTSLYTVRSLAANGNRDSRDGVCEEEDCERVRVQELLVPAHSVLHAAGEDALALGPSARKLDRTAR